MTNELVKLQGNISPNAVFNAFDELFFPMRRFSSYFNDPSLKGFESQIRDNTLILTKDLPGIKKENINLTINNGNVSLDFEFNSEEISSERRTKIERYEKTSYSIPSKFDVDYEKITANLEDGILEIKIPINNSIEKNRKILIE